jgi:hypothetical protein
MSYPTFVPLSIECYRNPSTVFFGNHLISSSVGAQQGDPCGPNIISLAIQPIILSLDSQLNIWYLDDGTLADYPEVVLSDCIVLKNSKNEKFPIHFCLVYIYIHIKVMWYNKRFLSTAAWIRPYNHIHL